MAGERGSSGGSACGFQSARARALECNDIIESVLEFVPTQFLASTIRRTSPFLRDVVSIPETRDNRVWSRAGSSSPPSRGWFWKLLRRRRQTAFDGSLFQIVYFFLHVYNDMDLHDTVANLDKEFVLTNYLFFRALNSLLRLVALAQDDECLHLMVVSNFHGLDGFCDRFWDILSEDLSGGALRFFYMRYRQAAGEECVAHFEDVNQFLGAMERAQTRSLEEVLGLEATTKKPRHLRKYPVVWFAKAHSRGRKHDKTLMDPCALLGLTRRKKSGEMALKLYRKMFSGQRVAGLSEELRRNVLKSCVGLLFLAGIEVGLDFWKIALMKNELADFGVVGLSRCEFLREDFEKWFDALYVHGGFVFGGSHVAHQGGVGGAVRWVEKGVCHLRRSALWEIVTRHRSRIEENIMRMAVGESVKERMRMFFFF